MKYLLCICLLIGFLPMFLYGQGQMKYRIEGSIDDTLIHEGAKVFLKQVWINATETGDIELPHVIERLSDESKVRLEWWKNKKSKLIDEVKK